MKNISKIFICGGLLMGQRQVKVPNK